VEQARGVEPLLTLVVENYAKMITIFFFDCYFGIVRKMFSRPFQWCIISPQILKISVGKTKRNLQSFSDYISSWSKELHWENDNDSFS
jgi:hypothetical protein